MPILNFPQYDFRVQTISDKPQIFDELRKKYVALTPEEWVRQHLVQFLILERGFPRGLMQIEATLKVYTASRRCDVVAFDREMQPKLIAECKAPDVPINEETFVQIATYNSVLHAPYLLVSNGMDHFCCQLFDDGNLQFLNDLPNYTELK